MAQKVLTKLLLSIIILLVVFTGVTLWLSHRNDAQAELDYPPIGRFVDVDGTAVHYLRKGAGPTIILLHGAGGNLRDFDLGLMDLLAKQYTVLAFDRPGHGFTDRLNNQGESPAEQAALLHGAAQKLGITRAIVAGFSYGGAVALTWALDYPQMTEGLVLLSAVSNPWDTPISSLYTLSAIPVVGPIYTTLVSAYAPQSEINRSLTALFAPQEIPQRYWTEFGVSLTLRQKTMRANGLQVTNLLPYIQEQSKRYPQLTLPIEIIHGVKDTTVPASVHAQVLAKQLSQAHLVLLPDLGHDTHHYAQDEILAALARISVE